MPPAMPGQKNDLLPLKFSDQELVGWAAKRCFYVDPAGFFEPVQVVYAGSADDPNNRGGRFFMSHYNHTQIKEYSEAVLHGPECENSLSIPRGIFAISPRSGRVAERLKAPVLKTGRG